MNGNTKKPCLFRVGGADPGSDEHGRHRAQAREQRDRRARVKDGEDRLLRVYPKEHERLLFAISRAAKMPDEYNAQFRGA
jgi:hypothetical protein